MFKFDSHNEPKNVGRVIIYGTVLGPKWKVWGT